MHRVYFSLGAKCDACLNYLQVQVNRLKEQVLRLQEERDDVLLRETKLAQENLR